MKASVARTAGPEVIGGIGGFAGLFDASKLTRYAAAVAGDLDRRRRHQSRHRPAAGQVRHHRLDLVGMVVDDLVVCGAEPLFMTDYVVCGKVLPERVAEHRGRDRRGLRSGGLRADRRRDGGASWASRLQTTSTSRCRHGVVDADRLLGPDRVSAGDVVIAMASSGLHSNGFSLVRAHPRLSRDAGSTWTAQPAELSQSLGEELLTPTRIYARDCLALADALRGPRVRARHRRRAGGEPGQGAAAAARTPSWTVRPGGLAPIFRLLAEHGNVAAAEMERSFNMGVGMVAVVAQDASDRRSAAEPSAGVGLGPRPHHGRDPARCT